tara:strand:- start:1187 stop:1534 length:348 start_codon:yes stop_codon:yes gene_type:complete
LKKLDPDHTLAILNLKIGDLFITQPNYAGRDPVIGFFNWQPGSYSATSLDSRTTFFKLVPTGTLGMYFKRDIQRNMSGYWFKFHEVWIGGKLCIIHEQFINPLPKVKGEKNEQNG